MKNILQFLFILFLEISYGVVLAFLYWLLSSFLFDQDGFGRSRINEGIYYIVILLPPFIYSWIEYLNFKKAGQNNKSAIYLSAGIAYLVAGLVFMLLLTDFYLLSA